MLGLCGSSLWRGELGVQYALMSRLRRLVVSDRFFFITSRLLPQRAIGCSCRPMSEPVYDAKMRRRDGKLRSDEEPQSPNTRDSALPADPAWGWGWIGWSDCYRFTRTELQDLKRSEQILREGLTENTLSVEQNPGTSHPRFPRASRGKGTAARGHHGFAYRKVANACILNLQGTQNRNPGLETLLEGLVSQGGLNVAKVFL